MNSNREIVKNGLWTNNPALVQLLGLCPLLAVTSNFVNGLALGIATTLVLVGSNITVSMIRHLVRKEIRIPDFVIIIAAFVTEVELLMRAYFYDLAQILAIFIPLIVTNCVIIGRAESFASKNTISKSLLDGIMMGLGFTFVLVLLGGLREVLGQGTLFAQAHLIFGESAKDLVIKFVELDQEFLLAVLPPGAFIGLGLIIACKNLIEDRIEKRKEAVLLAEKPIKTQNP